MLEFKCYILIYSGNIGTGILPSLGQSALCANKDVSLGFLGAAVPDILYNKN